MDIIRLEPGRRAPSDSDCISIDPLPGGRFNLTGCVLAGEDSVSLVGEPFDSPDMAESEGVAWAKSQGVETLYVAHAGG